MEKTTRLLSLALMVFILAAIPAQAQMGYSTDSSGNLVKDKIGVMYDADGKEISPFGPEVSETFKSLCPLAEIGLKMGSGLLIILGLVSFVRAAKRGGAHEWSRGIIMIVMAGGVLYLPGILSLLGMDFIYSRTDTANIWSCLWS